MATKYKNLTVEFGEKPTPKQTNYDHIKNMSAEDLAEFINDNYKCEKCAYYHKCCNGECESGIVEWLMQEANENDL